MTESYFLSLINNNQFCYGIQHAINTKQDKQIIIKQANTYNDIDTVYFCLIGNNNYCNGVIGGIANKRVSKLKMEYFLSHKGSN